MASSFFVIVKNYPKMRHAGHFFHSHLKTEDGEESLRLQWLAFEFQEISQIELPENATRFHYVDHTLCRNDSLKKKEKKEETHVNSGNSEGNLTQSAP